MQIVRKVLTSALFHQQPINSAARNNHTLISLTFYTFWGHYLIHKLYLVKWQSKWC